VDVVVVLGALLGLWPSTSGGDYYQHEARGDVTVRASFVHAVQLEVFYGLGWWGRPDAKIPHSFLNLEATRTLERYYGMELRFGGNWGWGLNAVRRGVDELDRTRVWGLPEHDSTFQYSIGYNDGLRPVAFWQTVVLRGPYLLQWNRGTLPWHAWQLTGVWKALDVDFRVGGPRRGVALDVGIQYEVFDRLAVGLRAGTIEPPGWGTDQFRVAATVIAGTLRR
jgi:hypothetical protein